MTATVIAMQKSWLPNVYAVLLSAGVFLVLQTVAVLANFLVFGSGRSGGKPVATSAFFFLLQEIIFLLLYRKPNWRNPLALVLALSTPVVLYLVLWVLQEIQPTIG